MSDTQTPRQNHLLAALPPDEYRRLSSRLEPVRMSLGQVVYESGDRLPHVYFPATAIVSMVYVTEDGASAEIAGVGNEGILGVPLYTGGETMPNRAMVLCAGIAYQLKARLLREEFNRGGALQCLLLRYAQALMTQISLIAVCNRHHSVEQQLCRWLLSSLDRSPSNELHMTQELIANTLGVRREGVTEAAGKLKQAGLIHCGRGRVTIFDRSGLEKRACECYQVVKTEFGRLLPAASAGQAGPFSCGYACTPCGATNAPAHRDATYILPRSSRKI